MHPDGYHKSAEARARCLGCSHPEELEPSEEDRALAADLIAQGWRSTSNRYRTIERVQIPAFEDAVAFRDGVPEWLRRELRDLYASAYGSGRWHRSGYGEQRTLTPAQFRAFRQAGGRAA